MAITVEQQFDCLHRQVIFQTQVGNGTDLGMRLPTDLGMRLPTDLGMRLLTDRVSSMFSSQGSIGERPYPHQRGVSTT